MERLVLAGEVPLFFEEGPEPAMVSWLFRAGVADEAPARRGITHLVEHLALFPLGRRDHTYNGFVDMLTCVFYAHGDQSELEGFLDEVSASLAALPFERLETEKGVLQREAESYGPDVVTRMLAFRFGSRGYGAPILAEMGLRWLGEDETEAWRCGRFTSENAAVWVHGPKPPNVVLDLPTGSRQPPPRPVELRGLSFPGFVAEGSGGVAAAMTARREWAATATLDLARGRLHERLRTERGLTYHPWSDYGVLGSEYAHLAIGADCRDEDAKHVAAEVLEIIHDLGEHGPTDEELEGTKRQAERSIQEDPDRVRRALDRAAFEELAGSRHPPLDEELHKLRSLTAADIQAVVEASSRTLLLLAPADTPKPSEDFQDLDRPASDISGRRFRTKALRQGDELIIGEDGLKWSKDDVSVAIPADELNVVIEGSGDELIISGIDGSWIEINPSKLKEPDDAVQAVRKLSPDPFVPSDDERPGWVKRLATEKLDRQWVVQEELSLLPDVLERDERPLTMAEASRGMRAGLLVVTERRVLFLYTGLRKEEFLRFPRTQVRASRPRWQLTGASIQLQAEGEELKFSDITPKARAEEIIEAISD